ncbi:hypothetical protein DSO57_1034391 [Entomophthora muscae]|uniref:Uncharacterized protein n=1 Tax=Entomophthora muscae TaxID=34485 RepID=A0ACC2TLV9_9FUNG|nr:hypothetical protein DSO57_1034391 [Entomophthora muscae]
MASVLLTILVIAFLCMVWFFAESQPQVLDIDFTGEVYDYRSAVLDLDTKWLPPIPGHPNTFPALQMSSHSTCANSPKGPYVNCLKVLSIFYYLDSIDNSQPTHQKHMDNCESINSTYSYFDVATMNVTPAFFLESLINRPNPMSLPFRPTAAPNHFTRKLFIKANVMVSYLQGSGLTIPPPNRILTLFFPVANKGTQQTIVPDE